ncbi:MAG: hypothetical protein A2V59_00620 [Armatimonadetes bacterium RBG_19FT_COMBO_69_19]|nr:MAG: hypothetical protein A2V59_00620 [Armatimonadetes bacterium RBG_19FT_COMBO_69_19]
MRARILVLALILLLVAGVPAAARHKGAKAYKEGQVYCTAGALVMGPVVIQGGRCYLLGVYRDTRGTFLAFINPAVLVTPGQLIRLDSSAGHRLRAQIVYLVPIHMSGLVVAPIPVNTIQLVAIREEHRHEDEDDDDDRRGERTVLVIAGLPTPELSVTFILRF